MIMPYLSFEGTCEEAFRWYVEIFDGSIQHLVKYGDMPENPDFPMSEEQKAKVMHGQVMLTETGGISGADSLLPQNKNSTVSIQAHLSSESKAQNVFSALAEDGTILSNLNTNPPPDNNGISGCVKDKYGFTWIISALK